MLANFYCHTKNSGPEFTRTSQFSFEMTCATYAQDRLVAVIQPLLQRRIMHSTWRVRWWNSCEFQFVWLGRIALHDQRERHSIRENFSLRLWHCDLQFGRNTPVWRFRSASASMPRLPGFSRFQCHGKSVEGHNTRAIARAVKIRGSFIFE